MTLVVAVEGLPGCGKTTAIEHMIRDLSTEGLRVAAVDIDTAPHASGLRSFAHTLPLKHLERSMIFWAMRIMQYDAIQEMRDRMDVIFADRSWGSVLAFDGYGNGISLPALENIGGDLTQPDITLLFSAPLEIAAARKESRTMQDLAFARRVEQGYAALAAAHAWMLVDATRTPENVKEQCLALIHAALAKRELSP